MPHDLSNSHSWRLAISLVIALAVHAVILGIPVSLRPLLTATVELNTHSFKISLSKGNQFGSAETQGIPDNKNPAPESVLPQKDSKAKPIKTTDSMDTPKVEKQQTPTQNNTKRLPAPHEALPDTIEHLQLPSDAGAKSRSTVFNPVLKEKLEYERNKVRIVEPSDTEYTTTNGTFVRHDDKCWEVQKLSPTDTNDASGQWFRVKCPKSPRTQSDIDRLAERYGIP